MRKLKGRDLITVINILSAESGSVLIGDGFIMIKAPEKMKHLDLSTSDLMVLTGLGFHPRGYWWSFFAEEN